jgi:hypothetical protein
VNDLTSAGLAPMGHLNNLLERLRAQSTKLNNAACIGDTGESNGMRITQVSQYRYEFDKEAHLQELGRLDLQANRW